MNPATQSPKGLCRLAQEEERLAVQRQYVYPAMVISFGVQGARSLTVSIHHIVNPFASFQLLQFVPGDSKLISSLAFFSSPPDAARISLPPLVTMTRRCRFFVVLLKNLENLRAGSWPGGVESTLPIMLLFLAPGACGGQTVTIKLPSLRIRSFDRVSTGDQSMSSCDGGGMSVISRAA
jgi:hypothetical protein